MINIFLNVKYGFEMLMAAEQQPKIVNSTEVQKVYKKSLIKHMLFILIMPVEVGRT